MNVAILGASEKSDRFSNIAQKLLMEHGHRVFPISRDGGEILGKAAFRSISEITEAGKSIDVVTVYLNPLRFAEVADEVIEADFHRIIFNPGTASPEFTKRFQRAGIEAVENCTMVMLDEGSF